jgi:hypothetical protein
MELEVSLPCSQRPIAGPYPGPVDSTHYPQPYTLNVLSCGTKHDNHSLSSSLVRRVDLDLGLAIERTTFAYNGNRTLFTNH